MVLCDRVPLLTLHMSSRQLVVRASAVHTLMTDKVNHIGRLCKEMHEQAKGKNCVVFLLRHTNHPEDKVIIGFPDYSSASEFLLTARPKEMDLAEYYGLAVDFTDQQAMIAACAADGVERYICIRDRNPVTVNERGAFEANARTAQWLKGGTTSESSTASLPTQ
jgi:hypothetical protein